MHVQIGPVSKEYASINLMMRYMMVLNVPVVLAMMDILVVMIFMNVICQNMNVRMRHCAEICSGIPIVCVERVSLVSITT